MLHDRDYMHPRYGRMGRQRTVRGDGLLSTLTNKLIAVNVAVFLLNEMNGGALNDMLCMSAPAIAKGEVWRFASYMFTHGGIWHLGLNMWGLYLLGRMVEQSLGARRYAALYGISGLLSGAAWYAFNVQSPIPMVGASGAIFGVFAAAAMLFPSMQVMLIFPPIPMRLRTMMIVMAVASVVLEITGWRVLGANIAHLAHLGGLFGGLAFMHVLDWQEQNRQSRPRSRGGYRHPANPKLTKLEPPENDFDATVDEVLDKIGRHGMGSLTPEERRILDEARDRLK